MALSRRIITCFAKKHYLRYSTQNTEPNFWEIVHKRWRVPRFQNKKTDSLEVKLGPSVRTVKILNKLNPFIAKEIKIFQRNITEEEQGLAEAVKEESEQRGLSATIGQYLVFNDAKVRFSSVSEWIDRDNSDKLPRVSEINNVLTGIDISYLPDFDYVKVKPIEDLSTVVHFNAQGCKKFDDYCLDYITGGLPALEELNVSDCPLITSRGLGTLYKLKNLRSLRLSGDESDIELQLLCVLLEEHFPNLKIEGVSYQVDKKSVTN